MAPPREPGREMKLIRSSNLGYVGQLRYIQTIHEPRERRNPDDLIQYFFPVLERWRYRFLSRKELDHLRSQPFYYYLLARTRYYDRVFSEAIASNVQHIVNIGCGSDTRAHRFGIALNRKGINVLECDLPQAILVKRRMAKRLGGAAHIQYAPLDLNDNSWPDFRRWLDGVGDAKVMVMMEGVSPYVDAESFGRFLEYLGAKLSRGSLVAYDFKLSGVADNFGRPDGAESTFRLPHSRDQVLAYHRQRGFQLEHMEPSWELEARLLPELADAGIAVFRQDGLVRIQVE